jgi:hypothetical protein
VSFLRAEMKRLVDFLNGLTTPQAVPVLADGGLPLHGAIRTIDTMPSNPIKIAITVNVYGLRSANRTIHIPLQASRV